MRIWLLTLLLLLGVGAHADPVHVDAEGEGASRDAAVSHALIAAIQQATGVTIDASQLSMTGMTSVANTTGHDATLTQDTQEAIRTTAGGTIRSYRVTSLTEDPDGGFVARVGVEVEVFRAKGLGNDSRRRIAVMTFADSGERGAGADLRDKLLADLTQSRRFAVVDRVNDAAYAQEMAIATGADVPPAERARAAQLIVADYVVTGHVRIVPSRTTEEVIELTGERIQNTVPGSAAADFQVIEIATRQIKWAGSAAGGGGVGGLADRIAADIVQAIYPTRLIKYDDPRRLVLNQGGTGLRTGQRFRAMRLGEALEDPYTHEELGQTEEEIGVVEVTEVQPKLSYARLVSGHLPEPHQQIVLRPDSRAVPAARPVRAAATAAAVPAAPAGGVRLPFDH